MCVCSYTAEPRSHKHRPLLACGSTDALRGSRSLPRQSRIVRYMIAAQGGIEPESWQRTADYILDTKGATTQGEKVSSYRVTNCGTDDPGDATALIQATQAKNTRSKSDKTYHLVYSFPPGERPPLDVLHAIEDELCAAIGYADHQRISAVHIDTDHLHVHVAINKVHPPAFASKSSASCAIAIHLVPNPFCRFGAMYATKPSSSTSPVLMSI